jgi:hypothetical protein
MANRSLFSRYAEQRYQPQSAKEAHMPYFSIQTSIPLNPSATEDLTKKASIFAAELLGKPEGYA